VNIVFIFLLQGKLDEQTKIIKLCKDLLKSYGDKISAYVEGCCRVEQHCMSDLMSKSNLFEEAQKARLQAEGFLNYLRN
jgi:hypothetical protein